MRMQATCARDFPFEDHHYHAGDTVEGEKDAILVLYDKRLIGVPVVVADTDKPQAATRTEPIQTAVVNPPETAARRTARSR